jgi:hypothetical protein
MYKDCIPGMFGSSPFVAIQQTYLLMGSPMVFFFSYGLMKQIASKLKTIS